MIAFLLAALLVSPGADKRPVSPARDCAFWSRAERRCRDADVEVIGPWDPRPGPGEWPTATYYDPPAFGTYPCEQRPEQTYSR